ncbi:MAG: dienelactone hydrolase family protein [Caulobacterales bacterium]|jgi:dienelactone hydrolase
MASGVIKEWDRLADFQRQDITLLERSKTVFTAGTGPAVIVMSEMPGITPEVARFARYVRDAGFTVYLPQMFGEAGRPFSSAYVLTGALKVCISREFALFGSADRTSPIVEWLKALAAKAHKDCGGKGVGAIGMCLTGNFALSMLLEPAVRAPVMCQPSLPVNQPDGMHISPKDLATVQARIEREDITVLAYRFASDRLCPAARFEALEEALGPRFRGRTLPDQAAKKGTPTAPHSVVTTHLIDQAGQPTRDAVDEILAFFSARLKLS